MAIQHLAVVLPAYNEAEGLPEFLGDISRAVTDAAARVSFVVVDDRSTDNTAQVLARLTLGEHSLTVLTNPVNSGHGPTAVRAYRAGLATGADVVLHVDGDGQFVAGAFPVLLRALAGNDGVHGARQSRDEPWFRRLLTRVAFVLVWATSKARVRDPNTPLRVYRRGALELLLSRVPPGSIIPHLHFSIEERRAQLSIATVDVLSRPRRGASLTGTMWGPRVGWAWLPPKRLRRFVRDAVKELWRTRFRVAAATSGKRTSRSVVER